MQLYVHSWSVPNCLVYWTFPILGCTHLWVVDSADRLFHLHLCYEILFLLRCGSCQRWSLVNRPIFPDFWTRPYTDSVHPPCAPATPALRPYCAWIRRCNALQILGDLNIKNAFNSKKRFFNEFKDLEDLEYWFKIGSPYQKTPESCLIFKHNRCEWEVVYISP